MNDVEELHDLVNVQTGTATPATRENGEPLVAGRDWWIDENFDPAVIKGWNGTGWVLTALHPHASGQIAALTEKTTPVDADLVFINDSENGNAPRAVQLGNLPGGTGSVRDAGRWEVIVSGTAPPVATTNEAEDDWVYGWISE